MLDEFLESTHSYLHCHIYIVNSIIRVVYRGGYGQNVCFQMIYLNNKIDFPFCVFLRTFHIYVFGGETHKEIFAINWAHFPYFISLRSVLKLRFLYQNVLIVEEFTFKYIQQYILFKKVVHLFYFSKNSK